MNRQEFLEKFAANAGITKTAADHALSAFTKTVGETLQSGGNIQLVGFGTFETTVRPAGESRNPRTGETMPRPEKRVPKFRPGKGLKDLIAG